MQIHNIILRILAVIAIGLVYGVIGLVVGAVIGGNFAREFVFYGVQGYEAVGQIGFLLGICIGLFRGSWIVIKRKPPLRQNADLSS